MFFKKKEPEPQKKRTKDLHEIVHQRILTAEGRRRQMMKKKVKAK